MFQAQYLFSGASVFSPWMPRQGDDLRVTAELVDKATANLEVRVFHKNREDTTNGTDADASTTITLSSVGRADAEWTGLEELVRYKFTSTGTTASHYVLFRILSPVWFDAVQPS